MKQFQVPQFITVEDKVIGPLTIKQSVFVLGGIGIIFVAYRVFIPFIFFPIAAFVGGLAAALAFLKINDVPFPTLVKNGFLYAMRPHVYIWKKEDQKKQKALLTKELSGLTINKTPKLSESKLSDLAWSLNIKEKYREPENTEEQSNK